MALHILGVCLASLALYLLVRLSGRKSPPLPPGPPGWPLIGNLLDIATNALHKRIAAMTSKYGPIICFNVFGTRLIFLNSAKVNKDLLEKQGAITANRPHLVTSGDLVGWNNVTALLQNGDTLRKHRKLLGQHIGTRSSIAAFYPIEEAEAKQFVSSVLENPDDLVVHCGRTTASCFFKISHGCSTNDDVDIFREVINRAMRDLSKAVSPGCYLVDLFPIMRYLPEWLPGCGFHKDAEQWRKTMNDAVNKSQEFVMKNLVNSNGVPSLPSRAFREGLAPEDKEILKWASFTMYLGGSDITPSMLYGFFRAMTMYPDIFKRAQAEVDGVIGNDRLPTMQDRDALPYVNAVCMEMLRWNVFLPLTAHVNTEDIVYEGYLIPKGTYLLPNIWFILSNPATYPEPEVFNPERFLGEHQQPDPREACFGWGRRQCLGGHLVESLMFIYVTMVLATLDVSRHVENGVEHVPKYEFEEGVLRFVKPFKCKITPRSKAEGLLKA